MSLQLIVHHRQGVNANTDTRVLKAKLPFNRQGPCQALAVGPCSSADTPDDFQLGDNLLCLSLLFNLPGSHDRRRAAMERCKPRDNLHDSGDMP